MGKVELNWSRQPIFLFDLHIHLTSESFLVQSRKRQISGVASGRSSGIKTHAELVSTLTEEIMLKMLF